MGVVESPEDRFAGKVNQNIHAVEEIGCWVEWIPETLARFGFFAHELDDFVAAGLQLRGQRAADEPPGAGDGYGEGGAVEKRA